MTCYRLDSGGIVTGKDTRMPVESGIQQLPDRGQL